MTSAAMSEAVPRIRNNVPAVSVAPSERAYQAFCVTPTPARPSAAAMRMIGAADPRDGVTENVKGVTVGCGIGVTVLVWVVGMMETVSTSLPVRVVDSSTALRSAGVASHARSLRDCCDLLPLSIGASALGAGLGLLWPGLMQSDNRCRNVVSHWNRSYPVLVVSGAASSFQPRRRVRYVILCANRGGQRRRNGQAERLCSLEVDDQLELCGLHLP
jgi:hypothetical protein